MFLLLFCYRSIRKIQRYGNPLCLNLTFSVSLQRRCDVTMLFKSINITKSGPEVVHCVEDLIGCVLYVKSEICVPRCSMGVRVMDTSWVSRRGSSSSRKSSSTPPSVQPPAPPFDSLNPEQPVDLYTSPSQTPPPISGDRTR